MYGAQPSIVGVGIAIVCYTVLGVVLGLTAGYLSGWTDRGISGVMSIVIAMPHIIILFVVLSVFRGDTYIAMMVFGILASPVMVLLVRSSAMAVRNELFVDAAKVSGLSPLYIIFRHILPRVRGLIIVQASVFGANAIVVESALSFLGFGAQPPTPTWGNMVSEAATTLSLSSWMLFPTGGTIALTALALGVIGDMLRDRVAKSWTASKLTRDPRRSTAAAESTVTPLTSLLAVRNLHVGYHAGKDVIPIVKDVSFDIPSGCTVGLVGESGSGKTTVAFGVLGVVGEGVAVTGGSVRFEGRNLIGLSGRELASYRGKRIAYVAQEPMVALDPSYRIGRQLLEAVRCNDGLTGQEARERVLDLLGNVELPNAEAVFQKYPHELSGGMAQRVSIAFALAGRPELLVADEPTTALDVTVQAGILGLLKRLQQDTGMSMLMITHDWGVVADVCDRVVVLYKGELVEDAGVREIFNDPRHAYTKALLASNPHGAEPGKDLPQVTGDFPLPSQGHPAEIRSVATASGETA
jgi:peptide/nickel transport system permease protein